MLLDDSGRSDKLVSCSDIVKTVDCLFFVVTVKFIVTCVYMS